MGFHVILSSDKDGMVTTYVENANELARLPLEPHSILIEGEKHHKPIHIASSLAFNKFQFKGFRLGILAERLFKEQAESKGYILEPLSQDVENFQSYKNGADLPVKRGDFLIRNRYNFEVEVKCRKFYEKNGDWYFNFRVDHLERHINMSEFTKTPIIIAVYDHDDTEPLPDSLFMMDVLYMDQIARSLRLKKYTARDENGSYSQYRFPINKAMQGFDLIEYWRDKFN